MNGASRWSAALESFLLAPANPRAVAVFRAVVALVVAYTFWPDALTPGVAADISSAARLGIAAYWVFSLGLLAVWSAGRGPWWIGFIVFAALAPFDLVARHDQSRQVFWFTLLCLAFAFPRRRGGESNHDQPATCPMWPIRLIQLQLTAIYGVNALAKSTPAFLSGDVLVGMSRMLPNFVVDLSDGYMHFAGLAIPAWLLAWATIATEYYLAVGFWFRRLRIVTAVIGVGFHMVLKLIIHIGMFDWASMMLYLAFLLPMEQRSSHQQADQRRDDHQKAQTHLRKCA